MLDDRITMSDAKCGGSRADDGKKLHLRIWTGGFGGNSLAAEERDGGGGLFWIAGVDKALLLGPPGFGGGSVGGGGLAGSAARFDHTVAEATADCFVLVWLVGAPGANDQQQQ
jgi:hypothetical protein